MACRIKHPANAQCGIEHECPPATPLGPTMWDGVTLCCTSRDNNWDSVVAVVHKPCLHDIQTWQNCRVCECGMPCVTAATPGAACMSESPSTCSQSVNTTSSSRITEKARRKQQFRYSRKPRSQSCWSLECPASASAACLCSSAAPHWQQSCSTAPAGPCHS